VRRFRRWLDNETIEVPTLYGPLMQQALVGWFGKRLYGALDTSMLWNTYCIVRLSVIYRGRAIPLVWCVLAHGSATVAYEVYKELLDRAAALLPHACQVVFLADRGFADTQLLGHHTTGLALSPAYHVELLGVPSWPRSVSGWPYRVGPGPRAVLASRVAHGQILWSGASGGRSAVGL
jgi:hypothetical protein